MLTDEQIEFRLSGIGASEIGAVVGCDPYQTALDVYMRKKGIVESVSTIHTDRGNYLEPALRKWASDVIGIEFIPATSKAHASNIHMIATPDGVSRDGLATLELKAPGPRTFREWPNEDEAPDRYVLQVAQQTSVFHAKVGYLVPFLGDNIRVYRYEYDARLERYINGAITKFWTQHIVVGIPPPVDGREGGDVWLRHQYPCSVSLELIRADTITEELMMHLRQLILEKQRIAEEQELIEQKIKSAIGHHAGVESPGLGKVTWKSAKGRTTIDWEAYARSLGATDDGAKQFTTTAAGERRFKPTFDF